MRSIPLKSTILVRAQQADDKKQETETKKSSGTGYGGRKKFNKDKR